jgi:hypothetical protein
MAVVLALGACSGGGGDAGSAGDSGTAGSVAGESNNGVTRSSLDSGSDALAFTERDGGATDAELDSAAGRPPVQTRSVISTGEVDLEADDLTEVRKQIDRLLHRFGGFVAREETHNDDDGTTVRSTLQVRVPSSHFASVMASFEDFSSVVDTSRKAEDVTTEVIDVDSRIRTQEISLERLRKFLGRSAKVSDVIRLEAAIAKREADLASLRAQQDYLADRTSLATITVRMSLPDEKAAAQRDALDDAGFLTGLRNGWNALVDVTIVGATVLGALLPFLVALGVVLVPLTWWLRSRVNARSARAQSQ